MNNYIKLNEDRWNNVKNDYTEPLTHEELFSKKVYKWVGGSTLGSYFVSSTSSHYDWAIKK